MSKVIDLTGKPQSEWYSNPNLLDNWYFADPIDQRQGYVVPPDTPYYSDTGLSAQAGTVTAYTTANYVDGVYGSVTVDGGTYYVDWTAAVRGYAGGGYYGIDRYKHDGSIFVEADGISLSAGTTFLFAVEKFSSSPLSKQTACFSVLTENDLVYGAFRFAGNPIIVSKNTNIEARISNQGNPYIAALSNAKILAAKLELGSQQTLAHQDADGNWVLNDPPPNRALELAKCQRYYQIFSSADTRPSNLADYRPSMRVNPALGTININGQTMYFADANL